MDRPVPTGKRGRDGRMTGSSFVAAADASIPRVSIVIPCFNSARTIGRCVRALAEQSTSNPYEIIVVHSGDDDTCTRARAALPGVRTIQLTERAIAAKARNVGVRAARGAIFAFIDSDAYANRNWIDSVVAAAEKGYDVVCGSIDNANTHSAVSRAEQLLMFNEFLPQTPERPIWFALAGNTVMPRAAYERFGPLPEVRAAEDVIFSRRLIAAGGNILFFPQMTVFHDNRQHVRPYLRNQLLLGKYTAMARRTVAFADMPYALFLMLVPLAPIAKLAKIFWRLIRWSPMSLLSVVREWPLFSLGLFAYGIGQVRGALTRRQTEASVQREGADAGRAELQRLGR
jgi:glycosyltransferase involved in cell wall biosynthesis